MSPPIFKWAFPSAERIKNPSLALIGAPPTRCSRASRRCSMVRGRDLALTVTAETTKTATINTLLAFMRLPPMENKKTRANLPASTGEQIQ